MGEPDCDYIMDYVLNSRVGNMKARGNRQLNKVIMDDKEYSQNNNDPPSDRFRKKLRTLSRTQGFRRFGILKTATIGVAIRKALKKYVISKNNMLLVKKQGLQNKQAPSNDTPTHIQ